MIALLTARDRERYRLRREIEKVESWLRADAGDRRAEAFHRARIAELQSEMDKLED